MQNDEETTSEVANPATRATVRHGLAAQAEELGKQARKTGREVLDGTERAAKRGLRFVKARARRRDPVGEATYRALELVSGGLEATSKALGKLGEATQPPARGTATRPAAKSTTGTTATARTRQAAGKTA